MSLARARTQTVRSGVVRTNHEATAPPILRGVEMLQSLHALEIKLSTGMMDHLVCM